MEAQLQMAKRELPMATFQPADIEQSLLFEDNTFHCILASRLLVHVVDLPKACDELIRVLKPGGLFICCEANMDVSMQLLTTDQRLQGNLQTKVQHMTKMCANPHAATLAYSINIFRHVRQAVVDIQSYSCVVPQPEHMDTTSMVDTQFLSKLVESGELAAEDQEYYLRHHASGGDEHSAAANGNMMTLIVGPMEISYVKGSEEEMILALIRKLSPYFDFARGIHQLLLVYKHIASFYITKNNEKDDLSIHSLMRRW